MSRHQYQHAEIPISQAVTQEVRADIASQDPVPEDSKALLRVSNLKMYFPVTRGLLKRKVGDVKAVDDVTFSIYRGETLGIVGESGSGKSTVGNCVLGDLKITAGQIIYDGHDLSVVRQISHKIAVMYLGKFVEETDSDELYAHPLHPYTQALISAAPIPNPTVDRARQRILLKGDIPSPMNPPKGCNFCTRCPYADEKCRSQEPEYINVGTGAKPHFVACHRVSRK